MSQMSPDPRTPLLRAGPDVVYHSMTVTKTSMENETKSKKSKFYQVVLTCLSNSLLLGSGMTMGFSAIALPYMLAPNSTLNVDSDQASWIASLPSIATPVGCLLSGYLLDSFGRRVGHLVTCFPMLVGWLLIALSPTLPQLYLGRILTGFAIGLSSIPAAFYTAEIADISIRGVLITGTTMAIALGILIVYELGDVLKSDWQLVALICAAFPLTTLVLVYFFLPESPVWLIGKNRIEDASRALMRINRASKADQVAEEFQLLSEKALETADSPTSLGSTLKSLSRPEAYKPFIIMNVFFFFQQITGTFVIIFYAVDVVKAADIQTDPFLVTVYIGLTRLVFTAVAAYMFKVYGRRPTALVSGVGMAISLLVLATHIIHGQQPLDLPVSVDTHVTNLTDPFNTTELSPTPAALSPSVSYLPISMLTLYIVTNTIGFHTLPWSMIGEVFPCQIRGVAGGVTSAIAYTMSFFALKWYPSMKEALHQYGVFYLYGVMAILGTAFIYFFLPETEGKTLQEIELWFARKGREQGPTSEEHLVLKKSKRITIVKSSRIEPQTKFFEERIRISHGVP